ncbi:hypothetical protein SEVIR_4G151800v4 [Setaria viridis]|uniref:Uncharacterized protein n=2 Tax=Setaria TaxID=4554 RepID=A0A368QVJ4_SETIT|nr:hypothetical protein SETIT_4G183700v2 [Setaria italica]TKW21905.1 hypothetical protein SEVIR_4G151800v2 [Setaria viridis]
MDNRMPLGDVTNKSNCHSGVNRKRQRLKSGPTTLEGENVAGDDLENVSGGDHGYIDQCVFADASSVIAATNQTPLSVLSQGVEPDDAGGDWLRRNDTYVATTRSKLKSVTDHTPLGETVLSETTGVNKEVSVDELQKEKENQKSRNRYSRMTEDQKVERNAKS